jgi:membrane-associated phospholipid phosphatase
VRSFALWLAALLSTAAAVTVSYFWLDRPIALWAQHDVRSGHEQQLGHLVFPDPLIPLAALLFVALSLRAMSRGPLPRYQTAGLVASLSILVADAIVNFLKFVFGRISPSSWMGQHPSFIADHVYGFYFFHSGSAYQAFPSGHMTATCAGLAVLWAWYPRWRALWVLTGLGVGAALISGNFHFLSDVIAGAFLGASTGWMVTSIWPLPSLRTGGQGRSSR